MDIDDIKALYYITAIDNMDSICDRGILPYNMAKRIPHESIAMSEIQDRRVKVTVPLTDGKGISLHDFVPLYFDSWNPMLSKLRIHNEAICIIAIKKDILYLPNVVIADRNASREYCKFGSSPEGLKNIDGDIVFARYWADSDDIIQYDKKGKKCAEALVPQRIPMSYFKGAIVVNDESAKRLEEKIGDRIRDFKIIVDSTRFF